MEKKAHLHPIFLLLEKIMKGYCRRDFKKAKIQIQKPTLNHLPKRERFIFIRVNPGKKDEQELKFYTEEIIIEAPAEFLGQELFKLKQRIENYMAKYPKAAKRNSYLEQGRGMKNKSLAFFYFYNLGLARS